MRDKSDRYQIQSVPNFQPSMKKLGSYLVDAGLLTADQINVVLNDQQATGMRFGEIVVARGWVKEQTIEWIVAKVVEPERKAVEPPSNGNRRGNSQPATFAARSVQPASASSAAPVAPQSPQRPAIHVSPAAKAASAGGQPTVPPKPYVRREVPISKPLPSVNSSDGDVNWVG